MKKLILLISLTMVSILFSGCCHLWFFPGPTNIHGPVHGIGHPR